MTKLKRKVPPSAEAMNKQDDKRPPVELFAPGSSIKDTVSPSFDQAAEKGEDPIGYFTRVKRIGKRVANSAGSTTKRATNSAGTVIQQVVRLFSPEKPSKKKAKRAGSKKKKEKEKEKKAPGKDKGRQMNAKNRQGECDHFIMFIILHAVVFSF